MSHDSTLRSQNVLGHQVRSTSGSWDVEEAQAVVARSIFPSTETLLTHQNLRYTFGSRLVDTQCTPLSHERRFSMSTSCTKQTQVRSTWRLEMYTKSARRCNAMHISTSFSTQNRLLHSIHCLDMQMPFYRRRCTGLVHIHKRFSHTWRLCSSSQTWADVGLFHTGPAKMHLHEQTLLHTNTFTSHTLLGGHGRCFGGTGQTLGSIQSVRFDTQTLLCDRCRRFVWHWHRFFVAGVSIWDRWSGRVAKRIDTRPSKLCPQFFLSFWRPSHRRIASFLKGLRNLTDKGRFAGFFFSFWRCQRPKFVRKGCARRIKAAIFMLSPSASSLTSKLESSFVRKVLLEITLRRITYGVDTFLSVMFPNDPSAATSYMSCSVERVARMNGPKSRNLITSVFGQRKSGASSHFPLRWAWSVGRDRIRSRNFSSVFDVQRPFLADLEREQLPGTLAKSQLIPRFWALEPTSHFVRKGQTIIVRPLRRHRPRLKRVIEWRARGGICRCARCNRVRHPLDLQMWRRWRRCRSLQYVRAARRN